MKLTIAIPTFNGAPRLARVIEHLQAQELPEFLDQANCWEILIVDNNSSDKTATIAAQLQASWAEGAWGDRVPLRYCFESQPGLAHARQRAITEAEGEWVGFIDDDNWAEPHWVASAIAFAADNPELGAFGSRIKACYESAPPRDFCQIEAFLAIRDHGDNQRPFDPENLQLPPGAGMVVHRQRWLEAVPAVMSVVGRTADVLISGSDYAALLYLHRAGYRIAYNPGMAIHHAIPAGRLERAYLLPLAYGIGLAICQLRFINAKGLRRWEIALRTAFGGLRRAIRCLLQHGLGLRAELNPAFLFCFYCGGLLSPLLALSPRVGAWLSYRRVRALAWGVIRLWPAPTSLPKAEVPVFSLPASSN